MKYTTVAVALAGAVVADTTTPIEWETYVAPTTTSVADPSTWTQWTTTSSADPSTWTQWTTTSSADPSTWSEFEDPAKKTTTTTTPIEWESIPAVTSTTASAPSCTYTTTYDVQKCKNGHCWAEKTTSTIIASTCTWSDWVDPAKSTTTPLVWESIPAVTSTTSAGCAYTTEIATTACAPEKTTICWPTTITSTIYAATCTWSDWVDPAKTTTPVVWESIPAKPTETETYTWSEIADPSSTWLEWESTTTVSSTVEETQTTWASWETATTPVVVTSTVAPGWSSDGWFGPAWPTATPGECVMNVVTSYGYPIWHPTPEATSTSTVYVTASASTWATWSTVSTSAKPSSTWSAGSSGHAPIAPNGNKWAMTYTVYEADTSCKSDDVIKAEIAAIAKLGFTTIRIYSTDCDALAVIGEACRASGIKLILGVFISNSGISGASGQVDKIKAWAQWDLVELIVIGNEAVFQGFCSAAELAAFIKECKSEFAAAGYTGPCTTTEPLAQWQSEGEAFCEVVDVVAANLYAFFNEECTAAEAGTFIQSEIDILAKICSGKETYVMESGWPSEGECCGAACPSKENQVTAIKAIESVVGSQVVFFSFADELWKEPGQYGVEQHWGCASVFGYTPSSTSPAPAASSTWASY